MAERFTTSANIPLFGDVDLEKLIAKVPREFTLKGMFFKRYVAEAFDDVASRLVAPPSGGNYHAFEPYPMVDYMRVFDRIARARFPGSAREAYRLLARGEVEVYAATTLGRVTFSMLRDPEAALIRYPDLFAVMSRGPVLTSERIIPKKKVRITIERPVSIENVIGVLEGIVMAFEAMPAMDVDIEDSGFASFTVRW